MNIRISLLLGWLAFAQSLSGAGLILIHEEDFWRRPPPRIVPPEPIPRPPRPEPWIPPPPPAWAPLETSFTKADIRIRDQFATTSVEQEFYNPNPRQLEGTFLFPVPRGAQIDKFTMEINGHPVAAELLAADKARGLYEDIVRKLRDPALLEYAGHDLFKVRIFPIEPNSRKKIALSYTQLLKADSGVVSFVFPLNTEKFSAKPIKTVSVKVDLETKRPLKSIYSPSHKVEIQRQGGNRATVGYEATDAKPDTDFQLLFAPDPEELGLNLLTYRTAGEDGYFLLLASPGIESKETRVMPKDVAFVLDTSGSMAGAKLEQAKKALLFCVENLNAEDRFEILRFSTEVEPLFDKLADAAEAQRRQAQAFIKQLKPMGGTAIYEALRRALAMRPPANDRPFVVIFLTDGLPTVGPTGEDEILAKVTQESRGNVRIFCFGIGTDVNTHLLDKITEETRAFSQYVLPEEDLEVKVSAFFSKIKDPVLASPKLTFPEAVRVTKLYPSPMPDLFKGEQIVLAGRYSGQGEGALRLEGTVRGESKRLAYDVKFSGESHDHEFIPRLWATRRVGYLLDEIRLHGENKELKDEIVMLARQFAIVTPYTAYLILEDEGRRGVAQGARSFQLQDRAVESALRSNYHELMQAKEGDAAVAGARSYQSLKAANAPAEAIVLGNAEVLRVAPLAAPGAGQFTVRAPGGAGGPTAGRQESDARQYAQQSQRVSGKTFFQNAPSWVDSEIQSLQTQQKVRIQFGSAEYFELLQKQPRAAAWLALGRNVQFALAGTIYEVYE